MADTKASLINEDRPITFTFQGQPYTGYQGDTIASALYRAGVRIFSRSFKYHRPRGLMTLDGASPNDLVEVNGTPNVHASTTPLKSGMEVRGQNAWPSLQFDIMNLFDTFSPLLPVGFYYKLFIRPRILWPVYEKVLRNAAGLGRIDPRPGQDKPMRYDKTYAHADLSVVGGGPAGMTAALAAAEQGARVTLIEQNPWLGGHLRYQTRALGKGILDFLPRSAGDQRAAFQFALALAEAVRDHPHIEILLNTTAFGGYADNMLGLTQGDRLIKLRTKELIVATGRIPQPLVFQNNDLPGILLGPGAQRLMNLYGVRPGKKVVVVTAGDDGWHVARELLDHDVEVVSILDRRSHPPASDIFSQMREKNIPHRIGWTITRAVGKRGVRGAVIHKQDINGNGTGETDHLDCDTIVICGSHRADNALLYQMGSEIEFDPARDDFVLRNAPDRVWGAGHAAGTRRLMGILQEGKLRGLEAAVRLGCDPSPQDLQLAREKLRRIETESHPSPPRSPVMNGPGKKKFVCFCEDVTHRDLEDAIGEGFDDIQTLKRYSTISMGPTQGKICSVNTIKCLADHKQQSVAQTGTTTSRPPYTPVKLGVLAGRKREPVRRTPLHTRHLELGARMMNAGLWKRPRDYGNVEGEVLGVRKQVGMIDVSTLGKMEVQGPDALPFLNRIYTNAFQDLHRGELRYGVMCTEEGIIFDDGIVGKINEDHYYLTTTSGGASRVLEWMRWWAAVWDLDVHITDLTPTYAALNLAGPRSRDTLATLAEIELESSAFPYMHLRRGQVAGVPVRLLRIGFVGELGYEIHYPAYYGSWLWDRLIEAGKDYGISPFGIDAQRILRLEKKHILIGQDTNALSTPYGANMGWIVDLDKDDFVGKPSLATQKTAEQREKLVGFRMDDPSLVPGAGDQMVEKPLTREQGHPLIGRVTSARYSPTLDQSIGMGWVRKDRSSPGSKVHIRVDGVPQPAYIVRKAFYDPEGKRVRM